MHTPVDTAGTSGTLCGLAYPYQRGYAQQQGQALSPPHGEVFDEIYFADFAHDDLTGTYYFDPEPPLAKLIIASGEWLYGWWRQNLEGAHGRPADLGFVPFGWRLMPSIFGTLCVPLMYLLALRLYRSRLFALAAATLTCFDGMFFIQSRIGMIDIFAIFFILLAYWAFHLHLESPTPRSSYASLVLTGVVVGLAIATKWIGLAALATMLFVLLMRALRRVLDVRIETAGGVWAWGRGERLKTPALPGWADAAVYLPLAAFSFFLIPAVIYVASYWPDFFQHGYFKSLGDLWSYNVSAYVYHATLKAGHPYGSPWYTWPFLARPVAYYYESSGLGTDAVSGQTLVAGMANLGNPWIWWTSVPCLLLMPYWAIRYKSYPAALISLGYLTQYLPWIPISRVLFLYHYFGPLIFAVLALALVLAAIAESGLAVNLESIRLQAGRALLFGHLAVTVLFFVYFYPVWTGLPVGQTDYLGGFGKGRMWFQDCWATQINSQGVPTRPELCWI